MISVKTILFALTLHIVTIASALETQEACKVFSQASCDFSKQSYVVYGEYLFLKITYPLSEEDRLTNQISKELGAIRSSLSSFIFPPLPKAEDSPFCEALTSWMMPRYTYNFSGLTSCAIESDESDESSCTKVLAFDLEQVLEIKESLASQAVDFKTWDEKKWLTELRETFAFFDKTSEDRRKFYILLGCPIVNIIHDETGLGIYGKIFIESNPEYAPVQKEIDALFAHIKGEVGFFAENKNLLWFTNTQRRNSLFHSAWGDGTKQLEEAKRLYKLGRDLPRIFSLLCESIAIDPIHAEKWKYLGGALREKKLPKDAIVAYVQSLRLDPRDVNAWKGLLDACQKAGMTRHAEGLKWYLLLNEKR